MQDTTSQQQGRPVTLKDIAEHCGVSKWTVAQALRGNPAVNVHTAERVRKIASELGYRPGYNAAARRLALRKHGSDVRNHVIALFFPWYITRSRYFADLLHGIMQGVGHAGYELLNINAENQDPLLDTQSLASFQRGDVDAAILYGAGAYSEIITRLREDPGFAERPITVICAPNNDASAVTTDDQYGAYLATKHLVQLGHRHIAHFVNSSIIKGIGVRQELRLHGARQALQESGLDPEMHLHLVEIPGTFYTPVSYMHTEETKLEDAQFLESFYQDLQSHPEITAVLAINDLSAQRLWYSLVRRGMSIPEDISIVGFDDTDEINTPRGENMLTSVRLPLIRLGERAVELCVERITGTLTKNHTVVLPTELIVRQSTTSPRLR
ncbi:MAG TPA: LacI family DNA-binding transcriptional regulator [Armatimonadota bacterium]|nr:LacI family DNA-binding transcriptional regulator [Armatimonadota bacterium]